MKHMQYLKQGKHIAHDIGLLETAAAQGDLKLYLAGLAVPRNTCRRSQMLLGAVP